MIAAAEFCHHSRVRLRLYRIYCADVLVMKVDSRGGDGHSKAKLDDNTTISFTLFEYAPTASNGDCRGTKMYDAHIESRALSLSPQFLQTALLREKGGMAVGEQATFIISFGDKSSNSTDCFILEIHFLSLNHTISSYLPDAHTSLPTFQDLIHEMGTRNWRRVDAILRNLRPFFAVHNKCDDYGIALSFKDFDLHADERLVNFPGSTMPWYGAMTDILEGSLVPKSIKIWEGKIELTPYSIHCGNVQKTYDLAFEKAALGRMGGLSLVRLDDSTKTPFVEVDGIQNGVVVSYPAATSEELLMTEDLIPVMWEYRRDLNGASETYNITATKFRRPYGAETSSLNSSLLREMLDMYAEIDA